MNRDTIRRFDNNLADHGAYASVRNTKSHSLADFDGNYAAGSAGANVAGGVTEMTMQNQNGVVVKMHATNQSVDFRLSVDSVSLKVTD